jgi:hypothetical protein
MRELISLRVARAFASTPHGYSPHGDVAGWLLDAPGALVQFVEPSKGTVEIANWLVRSAYEALDSSFPKSDDLVLVLDLHMMVARTAAARSILLNAARVLGKRFANVYVVPPAAYPPIYRQAFQASLAFARLLGMHVTVASSSAQLIARYGWQPLGAATDRVSAAL